MTSIISNNSKIMFNFSKMRITLCKTTMIIIIIIITITMIILIFKTKINNQKTILIFLINNRCTSNKRIIICNSKPWCSTSKCSKSNSKCSNNNNCNNSSNKKTFFGPISSNNLNKEICTRYNPISSIISNAISTKVNKISNKWITTLLWWTPMASKIVKVISKEIYINKSKNKDNITILLNKQCQYFPYFQDHLF